MKIGEVIEASPSSFEAQAYELHQPPPLGSLVTASEGETTIFALVSASATASLDPGRPVIARGQEEEDEAALYRHHPQLTKLLRTTFTALVTGHEEDGEIRYYLPSRPPHLHSFVYTATDEQARRFFGSLDFLGLLLSSPSTTTDEVIAAALRQASRVQEDPHAFQVRAGKELALLLGGQVPRLNYLLRKLRL